MINIIKRFISGVIKPRIKYGISLPKETNRIGNGDFLQIGEEFFNYFIKLGGLKPDAKVLDIGCGLGRMAIPLTKYLNKDGRYEGMDIMADAIDWCKNNITPKHSNFNFQFSDIFNGAYNHKGQFKGNEYKFPYQDNSFDFVFLTSVFTHMFPEDMENYLGEIQRVLVKGGKCMITFFLFNDEVEKFTQSGKSTIDFKYKYEKYRTNNQNTPEGAIAYDEKFVRGLYEKNGLSMIDPVYYGSWCGRGKFLSYQDIVLAIKK
jgi:ubiquinone/menaquinone biosynthesis C-methylase UbiE